MFYSILNLFIIFPSFLGLRILFYFFFRILYYKPRHASRIVGWVELPPSQTIWATEWRQNHVRTSYNAAVCARLATRNHSSRNESNRISPSHYWQCKWAHGRVFIFLYLHVIAWFRCNLILKVHDCKYASYRCKLQSLLVYISLTHKVYKLFKDAIKNVSFFCL